MSPNRCRVASRGSRGAGVDTCRRERDRSRRSRPIAIRSTPMPVDATSGRIARQLSPVSNRPRPSRRWSTSTRLPTASIEPAAMRPRDRIGCDRTRRADVCRDRTASHRQRGLARSRQSRQPCRRHPDASDRARAIAWPVRHAAERAGESISTPLKKPPRPLRTSTKRLTARTTKPHATPDGVAVPYPRRATTRARDRRRRTGRPAAPARCCRGCPASRTTASCAC